jgi:hypothetical protein
MRRLCLRPAADQPRCLPGPVGGQQPRLTFGIRRIGPPRYVGGAVRVIGGLFGGQPLPRLFWCCRALSRARRAKGCARMAGPVVAVAQTAMGGGMLAVLKHMSLREEEWPAPQKSRWRSG